MKPTIRPGVVGLQQASTSELLEVVAAYSKARPFGEPDKFIDG